MDMEALLIIGGGRLRQSKRCKKECKLSLAHSKPYGFQRINGQTVGVSSTPGRRSAIPAIKNATELPATSGEQAGRLEAKHSGTTLVQEGRTPHGSHNLCISECCFHS